VRSAANSLGQAAAAGLEGLLSALQMTAAYSTTGAVLVCDEGTLRVQMNNASASRRLCLLSNRTYSVMLSDSGSGFSRWRDPSVTRWREDVTRDHWGSIAGYYDHGAPLRSHEGEECQIDSIAQSWSVLAAR